MPEMTVLNRKIKTLMLVTPFICMTLGEAASTKTVNYDYVTSDYNTAIYFSQSGSSISGVMHMHLLSFVTTIGPQKVKGTRTGQEIRIEVGGGGNVPGMPCRGKFSEAQLYLNCTLGSQTINLVMSKSDRQLIERRLSEAKAKALDRENTQAKIKDLGMKLFSSYQRIAALSTGSNTYQSQKDEIERLKSILSTLQKGELPETDCEAGYLGIAPNILSEELSESSLKNIEAYTKLHTALLEDFNTELANYKKIYNSLPSGSRVFYTSGGSRVAGSAYAPGDEVLKTLERRMNSRLESAKSAQASDLLNYRQLRNQYISFRDNRMQSLNQQRLRKLYPDLNEEELNDVTEEECTPEVFE